MNLWVSVNVGKNNVSIDQSNKFGEHFRPAFRTVIAHVTLQLLRIVVVKLQESWKYARVMLFPKIYIYINLLGLWIIYSLYSYSMCS